MCIELFRSISLDCLRLSFRWGFILFPSLLAHPFLLTLLSTIMDGRPLYVDVSSADQSPVPIHGRPPMSQTLPAFFIRLTKADQRRVRKQIK